MRILILAIVSTILLIPLSITLDRYISNQVLLLFLVFSIGYIVTPLVLAAVFGAIIDFILSPFRKETEFIDMQEALFLGDLEVNDYRIRRIVKVEQYDVEGNLYLLEINEDKTLCIIGQYLYPFEENLLFPSTKLRVFMNKNTENCYGFQCLGEKVTDIDNFESEDILNFEFYESLDGYQIIEMPIKEVKSKLLGNA